MKIQNFSYQNFRNLQDGEFRPQKGVNIIYGENAQGKTNVLEAMWLFTGGRSFRGAKDAEFFRMGENEKRLTLEMQFFGGDRDQNVQLLFEDGKRTSVLNGVRRKGSSCLVGNFCAVIFSPEHLSLVKSGPLLRRNFIDGALCQMKPLYSKMLYRYQHTLQQRNSLLKDIPRHRELMDTLEIWDEKLSYYGSMIIHERIAYAEQITGAAQETYYGISGGKEKIQISYLSSLIQPVSAESNFQECLFESLQRRRSEDLSCGFTLSGPHRDDLDILINGNSARAFGSQGQQRSIVLALKFAEAAVLSSALNEPPVLFLDDVMSELDSSRQDYLLNHLHSYQVFFTCCEPESVRLLKEGAIFKMENGLLLQED